MTLNYEVIGDNNNNSKGDSILFLHGLLGNGRNLNTFAKKACQQHGQQQHQQQQQHGGQQTRGYLMDLRGHGKSRLPSSSSSSPSSSTSHSFDTCVQDIQHTLSTITHSSEEPHPTTIVGHSWGGRMALQYAATVSKNDDNNNNNNNLHRVWLLDTVPGEANDSVERVITVITDLLAGGETFTKKQLTDELKSRGLDGATSQWLASSYNAKNGDFGFDLQVVQDILPEFGTQDFFGLLEEIVKDDNDNDGGGIRVDLVRGGKNPGWTVPVLNELQQFAMEYPTRFGLHVLPKAGHWVHVDDMNGLVDLVKK